MTPTDPAAKCSPGLAAEQGAGNGADGEVGRGAGKGRRGVPAVMWMGQAGMWTGADGMWMGQAEMWMEGRQGCG